MSPAQFARAARAGLELLCGFVVVLALWLVGAGPVRAQSIPSGYVEAARASVIPGNGPTGVPALSQSGALYSLQALCDGDGPGYASEWTSFGAWSGPAPELEYPWGASCDLWGAPPGYFLGLVNVVVVAPEGPASAASSAALTWQDARELSWSIVGVWVSVGALAWLGSLVVRS